MCGIFGISYNLTSKMTPLETRKIMDHLFHYSQSRGKEASGILLKSGDNLVVYKDTIMGDRFIKTDKYASLFDKTHISTDDTLMMIGHARLDTNGSKWDNTNNSPLEYNGVYGIHNGIIVNVDNLWAQNPHLERRHVVDSEVLLALFWDELKKGLSETQAMQSIFGKIEGSASVAIYSSAKNSLSLATNTGSLYFIQYANGLFVFASENYILEQLHKKLPFLRKKGAAKIQQILPKSALCIDINSGACAPYQGRVVHALL